MVVLLARGDGSRARSPSKHPTREHRDQAEFHYQSLLLFSHATIFDWWVGEGVGTHMLSRPGLVAGSHRQGKHQLRPGGSSGALCARYPSLPLMATTSTTAATLKASATAPYNGRWSALSRPGSSPVTRAVPPLIAPCRSDGDPEIWRRIGYCTLGWAPTPTASAEGRRRTL